MSDIYVIYMHVYQFLIIEWIIWNMMAYTMKNDWEVSEEFDGLSGNRLLPYEISCCANCRQLHLQFAQINKKFQSDVNTKLIVQRSELIVSKKKHIGELRQSKMRKTVHFKTTLFNFDNNQHIRKISEG